MDFVDFILNIPIYIPLLINKFRYFSRKGYSQFPKAEYSILNRNLLLGIGIPFLKKNCAKLQQISQNGLNIFLFQHVSIYALY